MNQNLKDSPITKHSRSIPDVIKELITLIGEDPLRPGVKKTPERFAKAISELTSGYHQDIDGVTGGFNFQSAWTTAWIAGQAMGADSSR